MKRFIQKLLIWIGLFLTYKLLIWGVILWGRKEPLHADLGVSGKNQNVLVGSSNVYINYDFKLLNELTTHPTRSCWMPASYGAALNLFKLDQIAKKGDRLIIEYPYHWYLFDLMAPHNASFYTKANGDFYAFFAKKFPLNFVGHALQFSLFQPELWIYFTKKSNLNQNKDGSSLGFQIDVDSTYYSCNQKLYRREKHHIQANTFQKFEFEILLSHFKEIEKSKGVALFFNYPAMEKGNYSINKAFISNIQKSYPTLTTFQESIWEHRYLFDQRFHLNYCGTKINSIRLAQRINQRK